MSELTNQGERYLGVWLIPIEGWCRADPQSRSQSLGEGEEDDGGESEWESLER